MALLFLLTYHRTSAQLMVRIAHHCLHAIHWLYAHRRATNRAETAGPIHGKLCCLMVHKCTLQHGTWWTRPLLAFTLRCALT
jgi:hypothetical protein